MVNPLFKTCTLAVLFLALTNCKKDDAPKPSAANNSIIETVPPSLKPVSVFINQYISGYYESLPAHYQVTTKTYPLIIFLHGAGQQGDGVKDLPLLLNDGIAKSIQQKIFPPNFYVNGSNFSFVVLSPQLRALPPNDMVISFLNYAMAHYRVDTSRVYIAGISMGGVLTTQLAGQYTPRIAAGVSIAGASFGDDKASNAAHIAAGRLALWSFHNAGDPVIPSSTTSDFVNLVNSASPLISARMTIFPLAAHDAWTKALDATYRENNMNIYEWMLQYKR
jgi:predicted peptidase